MFEVGRVCSVDCPRAFALLLALLRSGDDARTFRRANDCGPCRGGPQQIRSVSNMAWRSLMPDNQFTEALIAHWPVWLVSVTLVVAAIIDGRKLKVPNWLTFPLILSGWIYGLEVGGWAGLQASFVGTLVGLGL